MTWLLALTVLTALFTALWPDLTASLIFSVSLFVILLLWVRKAAPPEDREYLTRMVTLAFIIRLSCAYLVETLRLVDRLDAMGYHWIGTAVAQHVHAGRFQEAYRLGWASGHPGYYLLVGLVYTVFGPNVLLGQNLNALASALTLVPIYFLSREISSEPRVARLSVLAFAWLPNSVIWSTQLLKDSIIVLLVVTVALDLVRLLNRGFRLGAVVRLATTTILLGEFRFYLPLLIYASCFLAYLFMAWQARGRSATLVFVSALLIIAALGMALPGNMWRGYFEAKAWQRLDELRTSTLGGESDFVKDANLGSLLEVLKFLPVGMAYFLAGPPPWEVSKPVHYLTWLDIPIWYPTLALGFAGMVLLLRQRHALPLVSICLGLTLFYSLFLANLGTAYRMRLQVTPFLLIAAGCYWYHLRARLSSI